MLSQVFLITSVNIALALLLSLSGMTSADDQSIPPPTYCPAAFKGKCQCGRRAVPPTGRMSYVTNCTNANFTDVDMLTQLSPQTEVLIFSGNNIQFLPPNLIGQDTRYENLHTIDLSNNNIKFVKGKTFHNVKTVKVLDLSNNNILIEEDNFHPRIFSNFKNLEELHLKNAFDNTVHDKDFLQELWTIFNESTLTNLKELDLDDNHIRSSFPSPEMFCSLPSLQRLHLSNNFLTDFTLNLTCLKNLSSVDVSFNFISTLNNKSLELIESGPSDYHINLTMNSFRCDCNLIDFFLWTKRTDKTIRVDSAEKFQCVYGHPMDNAGRFFDDLSEMDLECYDSIKNDDFRDYISISYAILTCLVLMLIGLIVALLYINRQFLRNSWTYLSTGLISKRQYTSLEQHRNKANQEVAEVEV